MPSCLRRTLRITPNEPWPACRGEGRRQRGRTGTQRGGTGRSAERHDIPIFSSTSYLSLSDMLANDDETRQALRSNTWRSAAAPTPCAERRGEERRRGKKRGEAGVRKEKEGSCCCCVLCAVWLVPIALESFFLSFFFFFFSLSLSRFSLSLCVCCPRSLACCLDPVREPAGGWCERCEVCEVCEVCVVLQRKRKASDVSCSAPASCQRSRVNRPRRCLGNRRRIGNCGQRGAPPGTQGLLRGRERHGIGCGHAQAPVRTFSLVSTRLAWK